MNFLCDAINIKVNCQRIIDLTVVIVRRKENVMEILRSFFSNSPNFLSFQAPESYKNVTDVVNTCHEAGISKKTVKLRPIAVIKG